MEKKATLTSPTENQAARKKVLIIDIDGCRPDALIAAQTPNIDALVRDGLVSYEAQTCQETVSAPSWSSMLTGVWPRKHGVRENSFNGSRFDGYPHVFRRLKDACNGAVTASIVNWEPIHSNIVTQADLSTAYPKDAEVAQAASQFLSQHDPDVLFLQFDEVDQAGHSYGYGPSVPAYLDALELLDGSVGVVLTALRGRKSYGQEDWLILISTDHGGSGREHGENVPEHRTIFLIVSGPATARGQIESPPLVVDIPPTIFTHLGLSMDPAWGWDGQPVDYQVQRLQSPRGGTNPGAKER